MGPICVLSDAHLLYQAEWVEDERTLRDEAKEVLDNFDKAMKNVARQSPSAVILAGDMFDTKAESGQRVAYREAEKYMLRIREILNELADQTGCKFYALRGNHDSEPVLRSLESVMKGKLEYSGDQTISIGQTSIALMNTHYLTGFYDIDAADFPKKADILIMHESVPISDVQGPPTETFVEICRRFQTVFNGHMHFHQENVLGIPNFTLLPAFIPSRRIKNNWMRKYRYEDGRIGTETQESPFGYIVIKDNGSEFVRYTPLQIIVRVELTGKTPNDFIQGIQQIYGLLMEKEEKDKFRVWIVTNADKITVDRVLRDRVQQYPEIRTMDIITEREESLRAPVPTIEKEFGDAAFTRDELTEKVLDSLRGKQLEIARGLFDEIFTLQVLERGKPDERVAFRRLLELVSKDEGVSESFVQLVYDLSKAG